MFIGEYEHNLDEKGRLALPARFRIKLVEGVVVTRGLDSCLSVYPLKEWRKIAEKLANLPISQASSRSFARFMLTGAMDLTPDKQGRIVLPEYLRNYASLEKTAIVAGLYNRLEIWDKSAWEKYRLGAEQKSTEIAETMGELGI